MISIFNLIFTVATGLISSIKISTWTLKIWIEFGNRNQSFHPSTAFLIPQSCKKKQIKLIYLGTQKHIFLNSLLWLVSFKASIKDFTLVVDESVKQKHYLTFHREVWKSIKTEKKIENDSSPYSNYPKKWLQLLASRSQSEILQERWMIHLENFYSWSLHQTSDSSKLREGGCKIDLSRLKNEMLSEKTQFDYERQNLNRQN